MRWRSLSVSVVLAAPLGGALSAAGSASPPGPNAIAETLAASTRNGLPGTAAAQVSADLGARSESKGVGEDVSKDDAPVPLPVPLAGNAPRETTKAVPVTSETTATETAASSSASLPRRRGFASTSKRSHISVQNEKLLTNVVSVVSSGNFARARRLLSQEIKRLRSTLEVTSASHEEHREITRSLGHSLFLLGDVSSRAGKLKDAQRLTQEAAPYLLSAYGTFHSVAGWLSTSSRLPLPLSLSLSLFQTHIYTSGPGSQYAHRVFDLLQTIYAAQGKADKAKPVAMEIMNAHAKKYGYKLPGEKLLWPSQSEVRSLEAGGVVDCQTSHSRNHIRRYTEILLSQVFERSRATLFSSHLSDSSSQRRQQKSGGKSCTTKECRGTFLEIRLSTPHCNNALLSPHPIPYPASSFCPRTHTLVHIQSPSKEDAKLFKYFLKVTKMLRDIRSTTKMTRNCVISSSETNLSRMRPWRECNRMATNALSLLRKEYKRYRRLSLDNKSVTKEKSIEFRRRLALLTSFTDGPNAYLSKVTNLKAKLEAQEVLDRQAKVTQRKIKSRLEKSEGKTTKSESEKAKAQTETPDLFSSLQDRISAMITAAFGVSLLQTQYACLLCNSLTNVLHQTNIQAGREVTLLVAYFTVFFTIVWLLGSREIKRKFKRLKRSGAELCSRVLNHVSSASSNAGSKARDAILGLLLRSDDSDEKVSIDDVKSKKVRANSIPKKRKSKRRGSHNKSKTTEERHKSVPIKAKVAAEEKEKATSKSEPAEIARVVKAEDEELGSTTMQEESETEPVVLICKEAVAKRGNKKRTPSLLSMSMEKAREKESGGGVFKEEQENDDEDDEEGDQNKELKTKKKIIQKIEIENDTSGSGDEEQDETKIVAAAMDAAESSKRNTLPKHEKKSTPNDQELEDLFGSVGTEEVVSDEKRGRSPTSLACANPQDEGKTSAAKGSNSGKVRRSRKQRELARIAKRRAATISTVDERVSTPDAFVSKKGRDHDTPALDHVPSSGFVSLYSRVCSGLD